MIKINMKVLILLSVVFISNTFWGQNIIGLKSDSPENLKEKLEKETNIQQQYRFLIRLAEYGPSSIPVLKTVCKYLDSKEPMVQAAALQIFISAGKVYPEVVPKLVKIIKKRPKGKVQLELRGIAVAALVETCNDPEIFRKLFKTADKSLISTLSTALQDKLELNKRLSSFINWPKPEISGIDKSVIVNGDFEQNSGNLPNGWELILKDGAVGLCQIDSTKSYSGKKSLLLRKKNGKGYLELRTKEMLTIPANAFWTWRGFYHAENAPASSLLLFRLEDENGQVSAHDNVPRPGWGWQSQSFLLNAPSNEWRKRLLILRPANKERKFRLIVRIYGNPCKVWLDKLTFPSPSWYRTITSGVPEPPRYTWEQAAEILSKRSNVVAKLTKGANGQMLLKLNGKIVPPALYFPWRSEYGDFDKFNKAGIKIHNVVLPINDSSEFTHGKLADTGQFKNLGLGPVWSSAKNKKFNFEPLFSKLRDYVRKNPRGYIMLGFHITWPKDYVEVNPDTAWMDKNGYYAYGNQHFMSGFKPEKEITAPLLCWPSPYSNKPFEDVANVLRSFAKELQETDFSKIIVGCFVCGGHDGQFEILRRDFGPNGQSAWRKWLRNKYKRNYHLRQAWSDKNVTFNNAPVPVNSYNRPKDSTGSPVFYSPETEQADRDYSEFRQERTWFLKEYLVKTIKNEFDKPLLGVTWLMGGFLDKYCRPFINSKYLDIAVVQPLYQHRMPGMMTGTCAPFESLKQHRKMLFKELDLRSWFREGYYNELASMKIGTPDSVAAFKSVNRKEIGQMIAHRAGGWWYYDISEHAFNHPELLKEIKRSAEVAKLVDSQDQKFHPEIVVVLTHSAPITTRMKVWKYTNEVNWFTGYQIFALKLSGVPFDTCFLEDIIKNPELQKYKIYVFLNSQDLGNQEIKFINQKLKRNGNTLLWHYAPGYLNPDQHCYDIQRTIDLTGIKVKTSNKQKNYRVYAEPNIKALLPLQGMGDIFKSCFGVEMNSKNMLTQRFVIDDPTAKQLAFYVDDDTTAIAQKAMNGWNSVYVSPLGGISGELLHQLAVDNKIYTVCAPNIAQVEMNGAFISISPMKNGILKLNLPRKCTVIDAFSLEKIGENTNKVSISVSAGNTRWLLLK